MTRTMARTNQLSRTIRVAAKLPPAQARKVLALLCKEPDADGADPLARTIDGLKALLDAHLQPLCKAMEGALQEEDMPAFRAALKKVSKRLPDFLPNPALEEAMAVLSARALSDFPQS